MSNSDPSCLGSSCSDVGGNPLLTICVLSHNRGPQVEALLLFLNANLLRRYGSQVELVVVNNCSTDDTARRLARYSEPSVRVIERTALLPTAEENMMRSVDLCKGEYVWFLGDDDYPSMDAVDGLVQLLAEKKVDLVVANTAAVSEIGDLIVDHVLDLRVPYVSVSMEALIASTGLLALLAGISRLIFRRRAVDFRSGLEFLDIQAIYAHVFWFISEFIDKEVVVFNQPLVKYTTLCAERDLGRFRRIQKLNRVGRYYYWGFGLSKLIKHLISEGVVSPDTLCRMFDLHNDGSRGRLLDFMVWHCYKQILSAVKRRGDELVLQSDYSSFRELVLSIDPSYFPLFGRLDGLFLESRSEKLLLFRYLRVYALSREFLRSWNAMTSGDTPHRVLYRGSVGDYRVYHGPAKWMAIHRSIGLPISSDIFRLDVETISDARWIVADTREALEKIILTRRSRACVDGGPELAEDGGGLPPNRSVGAEAIRSAILESAASEKLIAQALFEISDSFRRASFVLRAPYSAGHRVSALLHRAVRRVVAAVRGFTRV